MKENNGANAKFARQAWLRALERTAFIERNPGITLPLLIDRLALDFESAPALVSADATMSFRELASRCHQYARWGLAQGVRRGDAVSLLMGNCAEYLCVWLGLTRIGAMVALTNTHVSGDSLVHSINLVAPKLVIVDGGACAGARGRRRCALMALPRFGSTARARISQRCARRSMGVSTEPLSESECAPAQLDDTALYIYTSGTTGLPKAARISHYRLMQWSHWFAGLLDTGPQDRMYDCLPLYHSVGGVVAPGATLLGGGAVVIRARFSASDFWRDVCEQRCTLFQYIGELCRYLVNAPHQELETAHALRIACGNGLRPEIWEKFQSRFRIPRILEYYASTEGNFSLYNCDGEPGAIGRIPAFLAQRLSVALLRFDVQSGEPLRNGEGLCEACAVNEVGEAVGLIPEESGARVGRFEGYLDREASARKVLRNVFKTGDSWYRTGDLMRRDERGFFYFVDRVGETYRWKGENVSTAEVLTVVTASRGVLDGVVYGVAVPEPRAAPVWRHWWWTTNFDLSAFHAEVARAPTRATRVRCFCASWRSSRPPALSSRASRN